MGVQRLVELSDARGLPNDFIRFFDAGLIPLGEVNPKYAGITAASCATVEPAAAEKKAK